MHGLKPWRIASSSVPKMTMFLRAGTLALHEGRHTDPVDRTPYQKSQSYRASLLSMARSISSSSIVLPPLPLMIACCHITA